jgi:uncharacterized protein YbjT (DUF2867 family)
MKVILFGATGMVGQGVLRECLRDGDVTEVLAVVRSPTGEQSPKLKELAGRGAAHGVRRVLLLDETPRLGGGLHARHLRLHARRRRAPRAREPGHDLRLRLRHRHRLRALAEAK